MNLHTAQILLFLRFLQVGLCSGCNWLQNDQKDLQKWQNLLDWTGCEYAVNRVANVKPILFQTELTNEDHVLTSRLFWRGALTQKTKKPWKKKTKNKKQTQIKTTIFSDSLDWGGGLGKSPKIFFFAYMFCFFVLCFSNILLFSAFWACVCVCYFQNPKAFFIFWRWPCLWFFSKQVVSTSVQRKKKHCIFSRKLALRHAALEVFSRISIGFLWAVQSQAQSCSLGSNQSFGKFLKQMFSHMTHFLIKTPSKNIILRSSQREPPMSPRPPQIIGRVPPNKSTPLALWFFLLKKKINWT